ncbi:helix-turn-helix domain-containing protein [Kitasatospora aburaviensis]
MDSGQSLQTTVGFGELLRIRRERVGLTQQVLADHATLSVRAIRDMESGRVQRPGRRRSGCWPTRCGWRAATARRSRRPRAGRRSPTSRATSPPRRRWPGARSSAGSWRSRCWPTRWPSTATGWSR